MRRLPVYAALACFAAAAPLGYLLVPGPLEQVTMLMRDGRYERAVDLANDFVRKGERQAGLLLQAFLLNERFGDPEEAIKILKLYIARNPDNLAAWRKAAATFSGSGDVGSLVLALENIVRLSGDADATAHLAHLYRLHSRVDDELRILRGARPEDLAVADRVRLASLHLGRGELSEAVAVLEAVEAEEEEEGEEADANARIMLFTTLIELGDPDAAAERAIGWLDADPSWRFQELYVSYLLREGAERQALEVATPASTIGDPDSIARLAELLLQERRLDLVAEAISRALDHAQELSAEQVDWYLDKVIATARYKGLAGEVMEQMQAALEEDRSPSLQAAFVQAVYNQYGHSALMPYRSMLGPDILRERPVLAARLLMQEHNDMAARYYLLTADLDRLSTRDCFDWVEAAKHLLAPRELMAELTRRARSGGIPPAISRLVMDIAAGEASQPQLNALWTNLVLNRPDKSPEGDGPPRIY